jgi:hypothetical protein
MKGKSLNRGMTLRWPSGGCCRRGPSLQSITESLTERTLTTVAAKGSPGVAGRIWAIWEGECEFPSVFRPKTLQGADIAFDIEGHNSVVAAAKP